MFVWRGTDGGTTALNAAPTNPEDATLTAFGASSLSQKGNMPTDQEIHLIDNPAPAQTRITDPATSFQAAASITPEKMRKVYKHIILSLGAHGPMTDEGIMGTSAAGMQSPSGLRTRRNELLKAGYIVASYQQRIASGLFANTWALTAKGEQVFSNWTGTIALKGVTSGAGQKAKPV